jgi:hypothetical protein
MAGQVIINSLGFRIVASTGFETVGEALELANNVRDAWQLHILPKISTQYTFVGVQAKGLTAPGISEFAAATAPGGTVPGSPLPTFVAVKYKFRTLTPGRAGRGRTGLVGLTEASTPTDQPNRMLNSEPAAFLLAWEEFRTALLSASQPAEQVVISRYLGTDAAGDPVLRPGGPLVSLVTSVAVDGELGTRVSRLR